MTQNMPAAEVDLDLDLAREMIVTQCPDFAGLPVTVMANGWDNVSFRVGADLVARFPRREMAAHLIEHEATWLPGLAPSLPLPVPAPVFVGKPAGRYPWNWLLVPFIPGESAAIATGLDLDSAAHRLGEFLAALHRPAPSDAPPNPFRGGPLASRDEATSKRLDALDDLVDRSLVGSIWAGALDRPAHEGPPVWLHGDLHPHNILVDDSEISGVIDFGDITSGDPATDLAVAWMLFPDDSRRALIAAYGDESEDLWGRARGWALGLALAFLANSDDNEVMYRLGETTIAALVADET